MAEPTVRNDLRDAEYKNPGYVLDTVLPRLSKPQIAGNFYYQKYGADVVAQTGRALATPGTITKHYMASAAMAFSCAEIRDRQAMGYTEVKGYADLMHAELAMARKAKRSVRYQMERAGAALLLASPTSLAASTNLPGDLQDATFELMDKGPGDVALVMSSHTFTALKDNSEVKERMQNTGIVLGSGGDAREITAVQLAAIFGVKQLLVAPNDAWYTNRVTAEGDAALLLLPDENADPNEELQLGRSIYFDWGDGVDWAVQTFHSNDDDTDNVDCKSLYAIKLLNTELHTALTLVSAAT